MFFFIKIVYVLHQLGRQGNAPHKILLTSIEEAERCFKARVPFHTYIISIFQNKWTPPSING